MIRVLAVLLCAALLSGCSRSESTMAVATGAGAVGEWTNPSEPRQFGEAKIWIEGAWVQLTETDQPPADRRLTLPNWALFVVVWVENTGNSKPLSLRSWCNDPRTKLTDDSGNAYPLLQAPPPNKLWSGQKESSTINPGERGHDILVFKRPPNTLKFVRLELPADSVGAGGTIAVRMDNSFIKFPIAEGIR